MTSVFNRIHLKKFLLFNLTILFIINNGFSQEESSKKYVPKGLEIGTVAENFIAKNEKDSVFSLYEQLEITPVVVIFIRGQWCPVCNKHMSLLQDSLSFIEENGAHVIVISPEKPEYIEKTIEKTGAKFTILYDEGQKISDYFDVNFSPDKKTKLLYNTVLDAKLKDSHTDDSERLPVPATFIISKDKKIIWRQFDPNYKNRSTVKEIIENIPKP